MQQGKLFYQNCVVLMYNSPFIVFLWEVILEEYNMAYKLQLPEESTIYRVFHVSLLKKVVGDYHVPGKLPKEIEV